MRTRGIAVGALFVAGAVACSVSYGEEPEPSVLPDAAAGDAATEAGARPSNPCTASSDEGCLRDEVALFVSPRGNDTAAGTRAAPLATIGAGLARLGARRVLVVCEGSYPEDVVLDEKHEGVSVLGGVTCDWNVVQTARAKVGVSPTPLFVRTARGVTFADLNFEARDGRGNSRSSVAATVWSGDVTFRRIGLTAGRGAKGGDGFAGPGLVASSQLNGNEGSGMVGGAAKPYTCPGGIYTSRGGKGGDLGFQGETGLPGAPNGGPLCILGPAKAGSDGAAGADGAGATVLGRIDATGWIPEGGTNGKAGGMGQGGGGGGGGGAGGGGGGSGGAGGCPAPATTGAEGGGGSIALASGNSTVRLADCVLATADAGAGGAGAVGKDGQPGGLGGLGAIGASSNGCNGAAGGKGGTSGSSGSGAGGVSVGVLYTGSAPAIDATTRITVGAPGMGGSTGVARPDLDGIRGIAALQHAL